jgi:hypothetical protein
MTYNYFVFLEVIWIVSQKSAQVNALKMTSFPMRDQTNGHPLTPKNATLIIVAHQPTQFATITSMDWQI